MKPTFWYFTRVRWAIVILVATLAWQSYAAPILNGLALSSAGLYLPSDSDSTSEAASIDVYTPRSVNDSISILHAEYKRANCFVKNFICCFTCCFPGSDTSSPPAPPVDAVDVGAWTCTGGIPSLAELKEVVIDFGVASSRTDVFYTRLPNARISAECWFEAHLTEGVLPNNIAHFNNIVDNRYSYSVGTALTNARAAEGPGAPNYLDRWQKLLCQAYAEQSSGKVWVFMPSTVAPASGENEFAQNVWRTWEYPALTRNPAVTSIVRVDPAIDDAPTTIWVPADGPSAREPAGTNWPPGI